MTFFTRREASSPFGQCHDDAPEKPVPLSAQNHHFYQFRVDIPSAVIRTLNHSRTNTGHSCACDNTTHEREVTKKSDVDVIQSLTVLPPLQTAVF